MLCLRQCDASRTSFIESSGLGPIALAISRVMIVIFQPREPDSFQNVSIQFLIFENVCIDTKIMFLGLSNEKNAPEGWEIIQNVFNIIQTCYIAK